ncbi:hypothetical protein CCAX7_64960 [Capsulimonas corticalis]|uniref:Uncharacterized protein n=1 Tax=Capsulimonas corticalis TaxID=2219043 RepID=A0A402CQY7_9BACT|nr:DUF5984 family protein [Capsulimonas corticalis]BDI34445.1 hypothetical protein CCAX7_64960 [Capsulimonas corticalis]
MLFNFRLKPTDKIAPWSTPSRNNSLSLHWFGLTDGWFWIDIGGQQPFRYSQEILNHWAQEPQATISPLPFDDYQVTRYWEDLLELVPSILDPLPSDLATRVSDADAWGQWRERAAEWRETSEDETSWETYETALQWWFSRTWSNGHLRIPPKIWLWSTDDQVHIRWDCRDILQDGVLVWDAKHGEVAMPKRDFIHEVQSFGARLIDTMATRVDEIKKHWARPEIAIDIHSLEQEQDYRATICENALGRIHRDYEWDDVRAAIARMEAEIEYLK